MAGGTIGTVNIDILKGLMARLKMEVDTWTVAGVSGVGAMQLGFTDGEYQLQAINYFPDSATAETHIDAMEALQGTLVTIVDTWGNSRDNQLVKKVDTADAKKAVIDASGPTSVRVQINLVITAAVPS